MTFEPASDSNFSNPPDWPARNRQLAQLITLARHGSTDAFEQLYDLTAHWLLGHVRRVVADGQAEDVLADVYLQVWRSLASYDPRRAPPAAWLVMIARSRALDHRRRESVRSNALVRAAAESDVALAEGPEQLLSKAEECKLLLLSLAAPALDADERLALALAFFRDSSQQEIAAATGWSIATVRTVLSRAQGKVRTEFQRALAPHPVAGRLSQDA